MSRKLEVLIADDDPVVLHLLSSSLGGLGHTVHKASSGTACIDLLENLNASGKIPDILFLDLQLGDLSGLEILKRVREGLLSRDVAAIIVSASKEEEIKRDFPEASMADGFLAKPFDLGQLEGILESVSRVE